MGSAEPAALSKFLIYEFILQSECWDLVAKWQDARGCHGREERAFSGFLDTWPLSVTVFWRKHLGAYWLVGEGEVVTRGGNVGLARGQQSVDAVFLLPEKLRVHHFPSRLHWLQRDWAEGCGGGWGEFSCHLDEYISSAPQIPFSCSLQQSRPRATPASGRNPGLLLGSPVFRRDGQTASWLSLLSSAFPFSLLCSSFHRLTPYFYFILFYLSGFPGLCCSKLNLILWPGIEAGSLSHRTTWEAPWLRIFKNIFI